MGDTQSQLGKGVVVLTGPAGSGKTAAVLDLYRARLDAAGRPRCLILAPNAPARDHLRRRLLDLSPAGVLISPAVTTFAALAGGILSAANHKVSSLSPARRHLLLAGIVKELASAGRLAALGGLADAPGLVPALDAAIAELKRAAVEPEALAQAVRDGSPKDADLLEVYRRYQGLLKQQERFDVEGQMWLARDVLAASVDAPLGHADLSAVAADGFIDFTPTQLDILRLLAGRVETLLITLPLGDSDAAQAGKPLRRSRLWFWTARTLERIRSAMPQSQVAAAQDQFGAVPGLFDLSVVGSTGSLPVSGSGATPKYPWGCLAIVEAPNIEQEVRAVARAIKADLVAGAGSVAVLARNLEPYSEPIGRVFASHHIPISLGAATLGSSSVIRYILRLCGLPLAKSGGSRQEAYEFHDLLAVIKSSYFRPAALGDFDEATVATAEMAIRTANVLGGRQAYAAAFDRLIRQVKSRAGATEVEDDDQTVRLGPLLANADQLAKARQLVESLMACLDKLTQAGTHAGGEHRGQAPISANSKDAEISARPQAETSACPQQEYVQAVRQAVATLQVSAAAGESPDDAMLAADLRALAAFDALLEDVASGSTAVPPVASSNGTGRMPELHEMLVHLAGLTACPPARGENLVTVLDVLDARALRFDKVYLLGANEKAFPQLRQERCFIDESDRAAWAGRGVQLDRRSDLLSREMLLFYLAVTRGSSLTVSYVSAEGGGQSRSVFVDELTSAAQAAGVVIERRRISPGQLVPPLDEIACEADAVNAAIQWAFGGQENQGRLPISERTHAGCEHRGRAPISANSKAAEISARPLHLAFGLLASHRRWLAGRIDAFDGRIDQEPLLEQLARQIPSHWVFSASEINSFAACPWQFFARYLLHLAPLEEPAVQMTPAARGSFCHAVLRSVMTTLAQQSGGQVDLAKAAPEAVEAALAEAVAAQSAALADRAAYPRLWQAQTGLWQQMLGQYLAAQRQAPAGEDAVSKFFELGFGMTGRAGRGDPASRPDPVRVQAGPHTISLRGQIDRVDEVSAGGRRKLLAVDYKTGQAPAKNDIATHRDLQLALYTSALAVLFGEGDAGVAGGAYHQLADAARRYFAEYELARGKLKQVEGFQEMLISAMAAVGQYIDAMREGRFDAFPSKGCQSWCPYRQVCQYSPYRADLKRPPEMDANDEASREGRP